MFIFAYFGAVVLTFFCCFWGGAIYVCMYVYNVYIYIHCTLEQSTLRVLRGILNPERLQTLWIQDPTSWIFNPGLKSWITVCPSCVSHVSHRRCANEDWHPANVCKLMYAGDVASCRKDAFFEVQMVNFKKYSTEDGKTHHSDRCLSRPPTLVVPNHWLSQMAN